MFHFAGPVLLLAALSAAVPARAQLAGSMNLGVSATTFDGETTLDYTSRVGWTAGFGLGYDFGRGLSLRTELFYLVKGAKADATGADLERLRGLEPSPASSGLAVELTREVTYAEVPVLAIYRLETSGRLHPRVFAGPSFGYRLSSRLRFRVEGTDAEQSETDRSLRKNDFGLVAGGGVEVETAGERLTFEVRALLGRSNLRDASPAVHNRGLLFLVGIVF